MQRRRYLQTVGAVAAIGLAGCSDDGGDGSDGESEEDGGDGTPDRGVPYHIARAVSQLNTGAIALADYQDRFSQGNDEDIQFDGDRQGERLATARDALDAADAEGPTETQTAQIAGLRAAADALEAASGAISELRTATEGLDDVEPAVSSREFSTARERLSGPSDRVNQVDNSVSTAQGRLNGLDAERMNATDLRFSELRDGVDELADLTGSFDRLLTGYDDLIAAGETIDTARDQYDAGQYTDARSSLSDAETRAQAADTEFREGRQDAPERLQSRFDTGICQSGHLGNAISLLDDAARAESRGGDGSRDRSQAESELDAMESC